MKKLDCIIQGDEQHRNVFTDTPLVGFSNGKSLKNILVRAKLPKISPLGNQEGSKKCGKTKCEVCDNLITTNEFVSTKTGEKFVIRKGPLDCDTSKVVYLITCKVCAIQNVGSTKGVYRKRFNNYKSIQGEVRERVLGEKRPETKRGRPKKNPEEQSKGNKRFKK